MPRSNRRIESVDALNRRMSGIQRYNEQKHLKSLEVYKAMMQDHIAGKTKTEIMDKFLAGGYGPDYSSNSDGGLNAFRKAWKKMDQAFAEDFTPAETEAVKARLLSRYNHAYGWFVSHGKMRDAVATLDSMARAVGIGQEKTDVNILNQVKDGDITISFGMDQDKKKNKNDSE